MITIIGTGVVGLTCADMLIDAGYKVRIITASNGVDDSICSWWAGGMLAPYCEMESAEPLVGELGAISMQYWQSFCNNNEGCDYFANGTVVISPNRDQNMLTHFAQRTQQWQKIGALQLHELEPILSQHREGLFYPTEAHLEPRRALKALWQKVCTHAEVQTNTRLLEPEIEELATNINNATCEQDDWLLDCRGFDAKSAIASLRGVRGEMLHLYNPEIRVSRPIRLLHPRIPIYLVPRANSQFMLGATMIENQQRERASVRSVLELLSAVYAVNPAFSQSEIVEIGVDVRPAYPDNLPRVIKRGRRLLINGMHRHGYLLSPAFAKIVCDYISSGVSSKISSGISSEISSKVSSGQASQGQASKQRDLKNTALKNSKPQMQIAQNHKLYNQANNNQANNIYATDYMSQSDTHLQYSALIYDEDIS